MPLLAIGLAGWRLRRAAGDAAVALLAWFAVVLARVHLPIPFTESLLPLEKAAAAPMVALLLVPLHWVVLYLFGFYDSPEARPSLQVAVRLVPATTLVAMLVAGTLFLADRSFPRSVILLFLAADWLLLLAWRLLSQYFYRPGRRRVAVVGNGATAAELATAIGAHHWHGLEVVGHVRGPGDDGDERDREALGPFLGGLDDLPRLLREDRFDDLIVAVSPYGWQTELIDRLAITRPSHLNVLMVPGPFESLIGRMRYRWVSDIPLIEVVRASEWRIHSPLKRAFDFGVAALLLLTAAPVMAVCALAVRLTSPGPVLYRQVRVGRGQRPFTVLKFRTMRRDAETGSEVLASVDDPRLTPVGRYLRAARLDELPQLLHVLSGTMSLVGPRPERPGFVADYLKTVPGYAERFTLAPGLTGLAQVNGDYHSSAGNKLRYDLAYMANWSLWLDLSILVRTVRIVLSTRGV